MELKYQKGRMHTIGGRGFKSHLYGIEIKNGMPFY